MNDRTTFINKEELELLNKQLNEQQIESSFSFLNEHKGLRKGHTHLLLGPDTPETSTLTKSIILDSARTKKVLVWISDQSSWEYAFGLNLLCRDMDILKNISLISEAEIEMYRKNNYETFLSYFEEEVTNHKPDILIVDNLSTSFMCSVLGGLHKQYFMADSGRKLAYNMDIPIFYIGYTLKKKKASGLHLADMVGVEGSDIFNHFASYAHVLYLLTQNSKIFPIISIQKSRYHEIDNKYFLLNKDKSLYVDSRPVDLSIMHNLFAL